MTAGPTTTPATAGAAGTGAAAEPPVAERGAGAGTGARVLASMGSWPWLVLGLALLVRIGLLLLRTDYAPFGDPADYDRHARSLVDVGSYAATQFGAADGPSALRPPAYPYLLAGIYEVFGKSYLAARLGGAVLGTITVLLVWVLVRRVWNDRLARWAAVVCALAPTLAWMSSGLVAETLFLPLLMGSVVAMARFRDTPAWGWVLLSGLLLGAAVMTRTNGFVVLLPLAFAAWTARRGWRDVAVLVLGFALALTPWTIRNAVVLDTFAPLGTQSGITLVGGYNDVVLAQGPLHGVWITPDTNPKLVPLLRRPGSTEADLDAKFRSEAIDFAIDHPRYAVAATARHTLQLLQLRYTKQASPNAYEEQGVPKRYRPLVSAGFYVLLALAAAAVVLTIRRRPFRRGVAWIWAVPLILFATVAPLLGPPRYRLPCDPFLAILAAMALMAAWDVARRRTAGRSGRDGDGGTPADPSPPAAAPAAGG